jgi:hypothetical protein
VDNAGERVEALDEGGRRRVEQLVGDAVDAPFTDRTQVLPLALLDDFLELAS